MKRTMLIGAALTGMALALATPAHADGDAAKGRVKAITCMGCHGIPGYHNAYPTTRCRGWAGSTRSTSSPR